MPLSSVAAGQPIRATHVSQFVRWITAATKDQSATFTTTHATEYTATLTNEETSAGNVLKLVSGSSTIALFNKTGATLNVPLLATGVLAGLFSATGQILYGSGGTGATTLAIGTTGQALIVNASGAAPTYAASLQTLLASAGSMIGASGANTPAHIPKGTTAFMELVMNAGATGQTWASGVLAAAVTAGDIFYANGPNSVTRLGNGGGRLALTMNAGGTAPTWVSSLQSLITTAGHLIYGSAANTPAVLAPPSTAGQFLTMTATGTPSWVTGSVVRNVATSAVGATSAPTTTSTSYVDLPDIVCTITTSGGDIIVNLTGSFFNNNTANATFIALSLDGATEVAIIAASQPIASFVLPMSTTYRFTGVSSAAHTVKGRWRVDGATGTANGTNRYMTAWET